MLSSWPQGHCESSLCSFDECRTAPSVRRPSDQLSHFTLVVSPPVGCYHLQPPSPFIIITQPESWYSFTVPRRVESWVDLGTAGRDGHGWRGSRPVVETNVEWLPRGCEGALYCNSAIAVPSVARKRVQIPIPTTVRNNAPSLMCLGTVADRYWLNVIWRLYRQW